jgi:uncharacterized protein
LIFDAHIHLPTINKTLYERKEILLKDLKNEQINGGLLITAYDDFSKAQEIISTINDTTNLYVALGFSPLIYDANDWELLDNLMLNPKVVALKIYPGKEQYSIRESNVINIINLCIKHSLPLLIHTGWTGRQFNRPNLIANLAETYPELQLVICHMWYPDIQFCYNRTYQYTNVFYDLSSLAYDSTDEESITDKLNRIIPITPERFLFGSDYNICSIRSHINMINKLTLDDEVIKQIFYLNAIRLYNISQTKLI